LENKQKQEEYEYGVYSKIWGADALKPFRDMGYSPENAHKLKQLEFQEQFLQQNKDRFKTMTQDELATYAERLPDATYKELSTALANRDKAAYAQAEQGMVAKIDEWLYSEKPTDHSKFSAVLASLGLDPTKYEVLWSNYEQQSKNTGAAWAGYKPEKGDGGSTGGGSTGGGGAYTYDVGSLSGLFKDAGIVIQPNALANKGITKDMLNEANTELTQARDRKVAAKTALNAGLREKDMKHDSNGNIVIAGVYRLDTDGTAKIMAKQGDKKYWRKVKKGDPYHAELTAAASNFVAYKSYLSEIDAYKAEAKRQLSILKGASVSTRADNSVSRILK
jgi:hypothetical protein